MEIIFKITLTKKYRMVFSVVFMVFKESGLLVLNILVFFSSQIQVVLLLPYRVLQVSYVI